MQTAPFKTTHRRRGLLAISSTALITSLVLSGCSSDSKDSGSDTKDSDTTSGDNAPDSITLYSGRNEELIQPVIDSFTAETGITVEVNYLETSEAASLLLEEGDRSTADLFLAQDAGALGAVSKAGLFAELPSDIIDQVDATYASADNTWVGLTGRARVLVYNKDNVDVADLPTSVWDMTKDDWKGRIGIAPLNGSFQAFVTAMRVDSGDEATAQWLADMADAPQGENNRDLIKDVASGAIDAALVNHYYLYGEAAEAGTSVEDFSAQAFYLPGGDPAGLINVSGIALHKNASDNASAVAFINYLLGEEAQTAFRDDTYEYPLAAGITGPEGQPSLDELDPPAIDLNDLDDLATTVKLIQEAGLA